MNIFRKIILGWRIGKDITLHPELRHPIRKAVKIDGVQYYEFVQPSDMPTMRYNRVMDYLDELSMKINYNDLRELLAKQKEAFDTAKITDAVIINGELLRRTEFAMDFDSAYRLASVLFFNLKDNEDLTDYDIDYNEKKIEVFKREKIGNFFLKTPIRRYLPYTNLSDGDLETLLKLARVSEKMKRQILNKKYDQKR